MEKSRVLIIGATGRLGHHVAQFCLQFGHPTFALVRESSFADQLKSAKIQALINSGARIIKGSLEDEESLAEAGKQVDVVVSAIPSRQVLDQKLLIRVIKRIGTIKRFIPSEFGADPDKTQVSEFDGGFYSGKSEIRRLIESEGIAYTYICCNMFMSYLLPQLAQPGFTNPPRDKVTIFGDGNAKGVFVRDVDVAAFTARTIDDPETLNKAVYLRPSGNVYSMNELVQIWESKMGKKLEKTHVHGDVLLKRIKETPFPARMELVFIYSVFVKGDHTYFDIEACHGVNGAELYPDLKFTTISEFLDTLL